MRQHSRRWFVQRAAASAAAYGLGVFCTRPRSPELASTAQSVEVRQAPSAAPATPVHPATAPVKLGQTGLMVPRLAMGTGSGGWERNSDQKRLGREKFVHLMQHAAERGATFIDTADLYGTHEHYTRDAVRAIGRDKLVLLSKVWFKEAPGMAPTTTAKPEVERFLREMNVDMIDIVLVHCVTDVAWPTQQQRMLDDLSELKAQGKIRAVGCSCHSHAALRTAVDHPWVDVILARINPGNVAMDPDAGVDETVNVLKRARSNGKGVIGMKIYGAGGWAAAEQRKASLRHVLQAGCVDALTIGHVSEAQFDDTLENLQAALG